ncbi:Os10g0368650 [Oryza sativa Japonica Group]|uniref:Os10g0368650 protein n=1 Tax=Oryza sativa subsp. japonica TaxID=39947 RepID=A0A0N7KRN9_ORYSJ|nr:Os10g0368650 [Oryza sativa Japonica Group]
MWAAASPSVGAEGRRGHSGRRRECRGRHRRRFGPEEATASRTSAAEATAPARDKPEDAAPLEIAVDAAPAEDEPEDVVPLLQIRGGRRGNRRGCRRRPSRCRRHVGCRVAVGWSCLTSTSVVAEPPRGPSRRCLSRYESATLRTSAAEAIAPPPPSRTPPPRERWRGESREERGGLTRISAWG